ncbi:bifunctional arginine demethylase and lysyl-hydroxylase psr-1-like [Actinia tenebrosa]|uniref:Bifunctional arginine demethylase and lysyl-hydroxylase psr-1-like n=1 Tax=Actinia tenebrosa TaxID=6105 RepID=A0A6P8ISG0_ACTTE|nr:bifunctional arginine demethylase and lysyl-hydroxylase psr-1-like [Actinia tenebrosa]
MAEINLKTEQEVLQAFRVLRLKAKSLGIKDSSLIQVKSVKNLKRKTSWRYIGTFLVGFIAVVIGFGVYAFKSNTLTQRALVEFVADKIIETDLNKDNCLIPMPEFVLDLFRPPVDCNICKNISKVDRVKAITREEFLEKYAYTSRPVVIEDGTQNWTAQKHFSFDFFKTIYSPDSPVLKNQDSQCQFFPYNTKFQSLEEVFEMPEKDAKMEGKKWYIGWSNCDSGAANELRKYYKRPYFLPEISESSKTDWIFMGCPGIGAHMHIDQVGNPSWQAQISGQKKWTLEPPPECAHICHPKMEVVVHPGEIIVLDTNRWFHKTDILEGQLSITIGSEYD